MTGLLERAQELVAIPSVSHEEKVIADHVEALLRRHGWLDIARLGDNVVARTHLHRSARLVLAGHLDTVPPAGNEQPRRHGDTLSGLGSADMKGGLAVMLELAAAVPEPAVDMTFVFYVGEEVARAHNGLLAIAADRPQLLVADAAVLGEPTGSRVEAGCQGVLQLAVTLGGRRAHAARPWKGVNAIHRMAPLLAAVAGYQPRQPVIDGCSYREALQAIAVEGGVAGNVVPDVALLRLNHRFAPDRAPAEAEASVRQMIEPLLDPSAGDRLELTDSSPAAPPALGHPLLGRLVELSGAPPAAKLGWTDVAFFAERGIPAANFGPGDPELAHTPDERVEGTDLGTAFSVLHQLITDGP